jgi:hypothetical protein
VSLSSPVSLARPADLFTHAMLPAIQSTRRLSIHRAKNPPLQQVGVGAGHDRSTVTTAR